MLRWYSRSGLERDPEYLDQIFGSLAHGENALPSPVTRSTGDMGVEITQELCLRYVFSHSEEMMPQQLGNCRDCGSIRAATDGCALQRTVWIADELGGDIV